MAECPAVLLDSFRLGRESLVSRGQDGARASLAGSSIRWNTDESIAKRVRSGSATEM